MGSKRRYREICETEASIPLFSQAWWLDVVSEGLWDVVLVEKSGEVLASMPYVIEVRKGFVFLTQPPLTQCLGPWIKQFNSKKSNRLSREKKMMTALIKKLPEYSEYCQNWHFSQANWLPFYWRGFQQTTRYTYRLENLGDLKTVWSNLQENIRREIRKARDKRNISINSDRPLDDFIYLHQLVFERQKIRMPYSLDLIKKIDQQASHRGQRKIFFAEDTDGKIHSAVYVVWDRNSVYYLMGGGDPELRSSGATSLCMWAAIEFASKKGLNFDFEGSMIEQVERFFRGFNPKQVPYSRITHVRSFILKTIRAIQQVARTKS